MGRSAEYEVEVVGEAKPDFAFIIKGKRYVWWRGMANVVDADGQFVLPNPGNYWNEESQSYKFPEDWVVEEHPRGVSSMSVYHEKTAKRLSDSKAVSR